MSGQNSESDGRRKSGDAVESRALEALEKFLAAVAKPTQIVGGLALFIGVSGLVFDLTLSILLGTRVGAFASALDHFGAGVQLLIPTAIATLDFAALAISAVTILLVLSWVLVLLYRLILLLLHKYVLRTTGSSAETVDPEDANTSADDVQRSPPTDGAVTAQVAPQDRQPRFMSRGDLGMAHVVRDSVG